jgi:hypothetical protein
VQAVESEISKGREAWDNSGIMAFYRELANI